MSLAGQRGTEVPDLHAPRNLRNTVTRNSCMNPEAADLMWARAVFIFKRKLKTCVFILLITLHAYKVLGNFPNSPLLTANAPPVFCPFQLRGLRHCLTFGLGLTLIGYFFCGVLRFLARRRMRCCVPDYVIPDGRRVWIQSAPCDHTTVPF